MSPRKPKSQPEAESDMQTATCPSCAMSEDDWKGNEGNGYRLGDELYCCEGCAEGTGCTCLGEPTESPDD